MASNIILNGPQMCYTLDSKFPTLRKAPITEALIDIRVELSPNFRVEKLREFCDGIEDRFPKIEERFSLSGNLELKQSGVHLTQERSRPDGFVIRSEAEGCVVQARVDGFTIHKLPPYIHWESLAGQAKDLWARYLEVANPSKITRLAVRYTNRIEMAPGRDFKEAVLTVPEIAPGIPQELPEYFVRLVIPHRAGSTAIVTTSSLPPVPNAETVSMLFDIDAFRQVDIPVTDEGSIWPLLEELRGYKILIFLNSITPAQLERFL